MNSKKSLVVIGGNAAGMAAALRVRRLCPDWDITVIERTEHISISNCAIPEYLDGSITDIESLVVLTPEVAQKQHHINVFTNHCAEQIHPRKRHLTVTNLKTSQAFTIPYHRVIIATGADPAVPQWPNIKAEGIFTLRNLTHTYKFLQFIKQKKPRKMIVVGTGTIAQVCASALQSYGLQITMIGLQEGLMTDLEDDISSHIVAELTKHNISLYFTDYLDGIRVSLENIVTGLTEIDRLHECDSVLLAMGVRPNTNLAVNSGLKIDPVSNAIIVDRHLKTSEEAIYACGDCTMARNNLTNKSVYWPLATTAARQGREAAISVVYGNGTDPGTYLMRLWKCFDLEIGRVGLNFDTAQKLGYKVGRTHIEAFSKPQRSGGRKMQVILISDKESGRLLGAQACGYDGVHSRINVLSTALTAKLTLSDLEHLDFGYTPKLSNLWDPVQIAGRIGKKGKR